jgi:ABC-type multidrug transport system ATPase subunit
LPNPIVETRGLGKPYPRRDEEGIPVLEDTDLTVKQRESLALIGP